MIDKRFIEYKANSYREEPEPTLLAAGPSETMTDAGPARIELTGMATPDKTTRVGRAGVPYQAPSLKDAAAVGGAMLDMGASAVKGATQGFIGLPGDIEGIGRLILGKMGVNVDEATALPTTEEVKTWLDKNLGSVGDGKNPYESVGEVLAPGGQVKAAKAVAKGAKTLAPKAAEMIINATEKTGVPVKGLGITEKAPSFDGVEPVKTFKTADGFTLYELKNGSIVDNLDPERVDMSWDNFAQLKDDFGDDVYQVGDQLGERKAMVSSFGTANPDQMMDKYNAFMSTPEPDQLYQQALNKQNNPPSNVSSLVSKEEAPKMVVSDFTQTLFKAKTAQEGESIRFKNPLTLKDGSRLSGFTNPKKQNVFFGYDKNGELFTIGREYVNPEDIVSSRDSNKTADKVKQGLEHLGEYKAKMSTSQQEPK